MVPRTSKTVDFITKKIEAHRVGIDRALFVRSIKLVIRMDKYGQFPQSIEISPEYTEEKEEHQQNQHLA